jgi:hypothetical protein
MERLEHEADLVTAKLGEASFGESVDTPSIEPELASAWSVESTEEVE